MTRARISVLVSGGGTNLQALMDASASGDLPSGEIVSVISNRKAAYALTRARDIGIKTAVLSKVTEPDPSLYDLKLLELLEENCTDVVVLAGFLGILGPRVLKRYADRIVNIHPALIPSFCGMGYYGLKVHEAALARGVKVTGATAHLVNEEVDGGKILMQKAVEVLPDDTPEVLQLRVMQEAEWVILPRAVEQICHEVIAQS